MALTEHSSSEVCTQPDLSLRTQHAECFSFSRLALMKLCTCWSCLMHGENLAPRWIRASCRDGNTQLSQRAGSDCPGRTTRGTPIQTQGQGQVLHDETQHTPCTFSIFALETGPE